MARFKGVMASVKGEDSNVFVLIILLDSQGSWRRPQPPPARPRPTHAGLCARPNRPADAATSGQLRAGAGAYVPVGATARPRPY